MAENKIDQLIAILVKKKANGEAKYSKAEISNFLAYFFLVVCSGNEEVPPKILKYIASFFEAIQIKSSDSDEEKLQKIKSYFKFFPPNKELLKEVNHLISGSNPADLLSELDSNGMKSLGFSEKAMPEKVTDSKKKANEKGAFSILANFNK